MRCRLLPHIVRTLARTSLLLYCQNTCGYYLDNSQNTCFPGVGIIQKPICGIHNIISIQGTRGLFVPHPYLYNSSTPINTLLLPLFNRAGSQDRENKIQTSNETTAELDDELCSLDSIIF